jgi:hypothetical protein
LLQSRQRASCIGQRPRNPPRFWAPGAGGAHGATGYLLGEAAGSYLRRSQDRKVGLQTSLSGEPEYLTGKAEKVIRFKTHTKEVMGEA